MSNRPYRGGRGTRRGEHAQSPPYRGPSSQTSSTPREFESSNVGPNRGGRGHRWRGEHGQPRPNFGDRPTNNEWPRDAEGPASRPSRGAWGPRGTTWGQHQPQSSDRSAPIQEPVEFPSASSRPSQGAWGQRGGLQAPRPPPPSAQSDASEEPKELPSHVSGSLPAEPTSLSEGTPSVKESVEAPSTSAETTTSTKRRNRRKKGKGPADDETQASKPSDEHETEDSVPSADPQTASSIPSKSESASQLPPLSETHYKDPDEHKSTFDTTEKITEGPGTSTGTTATSSKPARQRKGKRRLADSSEITTGYSGSDDQKSIQIPARPDEGNQSGKPVDLRVNCFDITFEPKKVFMYDLKKIDVKAIGQDGKDHKVPTNPKEARAYMTRAMRKHMPDSIYDGGFMVCTDQRLTQSQFKFEITDPDEGRGLTVECTLEEVKQVEITDLLNYIGTSSGSILNIPQHAIRVLDCILKVAFKGQYESIGRTALFERQVSNRIEPSMLDIHRGFITSVRPQWKIRVNVDLTYKAFLTAGPLADVVYAKHGDNILQRVKLIERELKHTRVETVDLYKEKTGKRRKFTVQGLSTLRSDEHPLEELNQTIAEYFSSKYGIKLQYPELPCVKVNAKRDVYFPMELLSIPSFQPTNASKAEVASAIIRMAACRPEKRFSEIQRFLSDALNHRSEILQRFAVKINPVPIKTQGRVIDVPCADFGRGPIQLKRGSWVVPSFHTPADKGVINARIFSVPPRRESDRNRADVIHKLSGEARNFGLNLRITDGQSLRPQDLQGALNQSKAMGFKLVILVLHDEYNYAEIKRLSDLILGIPTQCVRDQTLRKPRVWSNLLLKINAKLHGVNWTIPKLVQSQKERFIVFGADVTHPAATQNHDFRKSVAAVTASYSPDLMRYAAVVRQQATTHDKEKTTREIIDHMEEIITELLKCYIRHNQDRFPTKLIFYRDGVSEGQFEIVLVQELQAIQRACMNISPDCQPGITYVVVQKRHRLRFMPTVEIPNSKTGNIEPGTVIDKDVVHHRDFDFYLSSAEGIQGTVKPAYYHVLYDDNEYTSEALQAFSFYLCHAYMRCSRSVSYPAPTYYAHLAAFRAREWLSGVNNMNAILDTAKNQFRIHESQFKGMFFL